MIENKYTFINYNGLQKQKLDLLTQNDTINLFSNKVIIIDEAHNFVSWIVNKLKQPKSVPMRLYNALQTAENAKIILLTGTPIINYPNEIAITMNILRGKINTWSFKLSINTEIKIDQEELLAIFKSHPLSSNILDYLQYRPSSQTLIITRNPFGFFSVIDEKRDIYKGVELGENGNIDDKTFIKIITEVLAKKNITILPLSAEVKENTCLPDTLETFSAKFITTSAGKPEVRNMNQFKSRILGLVSYFPDIDELLPKYDKKINLNKIRIPMSNTQFRIYEAARVEERKIEKNNARRRARGASTAAAGGGSI